MKKFWSSFCQLQKNVYHNQLIMRKSTYLPILLLALVFAACSIDDGSDEIPPVDEVPFVNGTTLVFTSKEASAKLLGTSDEYSKALSKFDIVSRTHNVESNQEQHYLDFAAAQAQEWTETEITVLKLLINEVKGKIEKLGLQLEFPEKIHLVKTTMQEEGGQAVVSYTRMHYIVLKGEVTEDFIIHELFHILTRHNPEKRRELYKTINFNPSNKIAYPASIKDQVVTNPDAPFLDHTINLTINGQQKEAVFILYTDREWDGGSFFNYMKQKLMQVEGSANNKTPVIVDGMPVLNDFNEASDLYDKIGNNTDYTLHPEEILADHFVALVLPKSVPDPEFINAMKNVLTK